MPMYQHILVATDLTEASRKVLEKAQQLARENQATLSLIHVVEQAPAYAYGYMGAADIEHELVDAAKQGLQKLGEELGIPESNLKIELGPPKTHILNLAEELKADLLIVGSHGRHGLAKILGSTANAVINGAECDVLTVRYQD